MNRKEYLNKRKELMQKAQAALDAGNTEEGNDLMNQVTALDQKFEAITTAQANMNALQAQAPVESPMINSANLEQTAQVATPTNMLDSMEYREAFMNFCQTGKMDPKFMNADEYTKTSDLGILVPKTVMKEIIKEMKSYGKIFARVRKLNIKGGVEVPVLSLKPTAHWIDEETPSDRQKFSSTGKVSFTFHGLECKVAMSLISSIVSLEIFEATVKELIVEAMVKAVEIAIIKGTGTGQPLGVTIDPRIPTKNKITLTEEDFTKWDAWKKKVFAKMALAYRDNSVMITASGTYEGYIDGMVDTTGQPIGRVVAGIDGKPKEKFNGHDVLLVEPDVIKDYATAATGDVVAVLCDLKDYGVNSNMTMRMIRYTDQDTNQIIDKAIMVVDGKILDPHGVMIIKKGAA